MTARAARLLVASDVATDALDNIVKPFAKAQLIAKLRKLIGLGAV